MRTHAWLSAVSLGLFAIAGCPTTSDCPTGGTTGGAATAGSLGGPVPGVVDNHCWGPGPSDGGLTFVAQVVNSSSCDLVDGGLFFDEDAGADTGSAHGPTEWNTGGNDDDCKYFVGWHSTPITAGADVTFWVSVQLSTNGFPLTGLSAARDTGAGQIYLEAGGDPDGGIFGHASPTSGTTVPVQEIPAGSGIYQIGPAKFFDESGLWYVRFHFNENCDDVLPNSPHGHAAFYVNVP